MCKLLTCCCASCDVQSADEGRSRAHGLSQELNKQNKHALRPGDITSIPLMLLYNIVYHEAAVKRSFPTRGSTCMRNAMLDSKDIMNNIRLHRFFLSMFCVGSASQKQ